ncbi:MAG: PorV/PorQ family protein [Bacteroidales bacterium]|nr:PorV/PorQ family protein [Bacteroidales bacterium]
MKKKIFIILIYILLSIHSYSQAPKYSNEFLAIGVGARSLAMANSTVACVNDITSTYWNPSGLLLISDDWQIGAMHSEYFAGIAKYDYFSGAYRINEERSFGFSVIRFGVDDIPNTLELIDNDGNIRYDRIKSFSVADYALLFSYASKSKIEGLRYGGNVKIIRRIAGEFASAWGFGFDVSAQYDMGKWNFGAIGRDITSTFNAWSFNTSELEDVFILTGNEIPSNSLEITLPKLILGAARNFDISDKFKAIAEIDIDITSDRKRNVLIKSNPFSIDPHIGGEIGYKNTVFFRAGIGNIQKEPDFDEKNSLSFQPNIGIGIKIDYLIIDYALTDVGDVSIALYSHIFSLKYSINKKIVATNIDR